MRISDLSSDVCSSDLGAQIDRHGVFAILRAAADAQKARAEPTRFGVAVVSDDPAFEQDAGEQQWRQRLAVERLLAQIGGAHLADHRALAQQIVEPLALDHREPAVVARRSEEHTSELQSLMRLSYAVFR